MFKKAVVFMPISLIICKNLKSCNAFLVCLDVSNQSCEFRADIYKLNFLTYSGVWGWGGRVQMLPVASMQLIFQVVHLGSDPNRS